MDARFKREKNITQKHSDIPAEKVIQKKSKEKNPREDVLHSFGQTISVLREKNTLRNVFLMGLVLVFFGLVFFRVGSFVFANQFSVSDFASSFFQGGVLFGKGEDSQRNDSKDMDILLLGRGGGENSAPDLTDTIIIAHFDYARKHLVTFSLPRDLMIESKILGRVKINEVYSTTRRLFGEDMALSHLKEIISKITGKDIYLHAIIDFEGFRNIIDAVGGIDIDVPKHLYDDSYPTKNYGYTVINIPVGIQHFDGDKALKYSRSRHTTSDFDRSMRQQLVIQALKDKLLSLEIYTSFDKVEKLYGVVSDSITTNFPLKEVVKIAKIMSTLDQDAVYGFTLNYSCFEALKICEPGGLIYTPDKELFHGMSVLLPKTGNAVNISDYSDIQRFFSLIMTFPTLQNEPGLAIVSASGRTGLANSVAIKLKSWSFPIDDRDLKNQQTKETTTYIRYNPALVAHDNLLLQALSLVFPGEKRVATETELSTMTTPYELVLGADSSLYF